VELRLRALDVRLLSPPLGVDRLLEVAQDTAVRVASRRAFIAFAPSR